MRVINIPRRGIGKVTLERLYDYAIQNNISLVEASVRCEEIADLGNKARQSIKDFGLLIQTLASHCSGKFSFRIYWR